MAFVALEIGLKINRFSGLPGGTPEFRQRTSVRVTGLILEAVEDHLSDFMAQNNKTPDTNCESSRSHDSFQ